VNAIFCFTAVYFNIKNRPHHIISKDEAKVRITLDHGNRPVPHYEFSADFLAEKSTLYK
jgi:hypothetical protein